MVRITECPRDAMQGIKMQIPTEEKAAYINLLLKAGFGRIDFGSFVSQKAIPQMQDTAQVLGLLDLTDTKSELLAIIANERGAEDACRHGDIDFLGFPFSVSETFQQRNTNSSIAESLERVKNIQAICNTADKKLLVYLSMAFGNPYGDEWNPGIVTGWGKKLADLGVKHIALADTVGSSTPSSITTLFTQVIRELPSVDITAHLHSTREAAPEKIAAAYTSGCRNFDVAIHGFGGCPMAKDELTGNIATEDLLLFLENSGIEHGLDRVQLEKCYSHASLLFNKYH